MYMLSVLASVSVSLQVESGVEISNFSGNGRKSRSNNGQMYGRHEQSQDFVSGERNCINNGNAIQSCGSEYTSPRSAEFRLESSQPVNLSFKRADVAASQRHLTTTFPLIFTFLFVENKRRRRNIKPHLRETLYIISTN